jgi:hypothetical protein
MVEEIVVVSGLPRSGTSMMMKMLEAGGVEGVTDGIREADEDNPEGYFEFEPVKRLKEGSAWMAEARGKGIKVVSGLLRDLPPGYRYKVIFMRREMGEVLASQRAMLVRRGKEVGEAEDAQLRELFAGHLAEVEQWLRRQPHFEVLDVGYERGIDEPLEVAQAVGAFLDRELDIERMAAVVNPNLYRQRAKE